MRLLLAIALLGLTLIGCSKDYKVEVRSDTSWSGAFGNRTVDGSGNQTIDIPDDPPECVVVQKETKDGYLEIHLIEEGGWFLNPTNDYERVRTTAEYGLVSDCTEE